MNLFVVGTDTEIGKTVVSAALCSKLSGSGPVAYWKPVASGSLEGRDVEDVARLSGQPALDETYLMKEPLSPHLAARLEDRFVDPARLTADYHRHVDGDRGRTLVIEGVGGIQVPLNDDGYLWTDWMVELGLPAVVVARTTLGTINHTLMTVECLRRRGVDVLGVLLNGPENPENLKAIQRFGQVEILGHLPPLNPLDQAGLTRAAQDLDPEGRLAERLFGVSV